MKVSYYSYYVSDISTGKPTKENINLKDFVDNLIKKQVVMENEFISHLYNDVYAFIKIDDAAFIKKINTENLTVDDINQSLEKNESIGFSSYFIVKEKVIGFASTIFSSKVNKLETYINNHVSSKDRQFVMKPIMKTMTKAESLNLEYIGRTTLTIERSSSIFNDVLSSVGVKKLDDELIDGIQVIVKPKPRRNIKNVTKEIIEKHYDDLTAIKIRAKDHLADIATEVYLSENIQCDVINTKKSTNIALEMENCYKNSKGVIMRLIED